MGELVGYLMSITAATPPQYPKWILDVLNDYGQITFRILNMKATHFNISITNLSLLFSLI